MRRRDFTTAVGIGLLAGCQGGGSDAPGPRTGSPTATATSTPTATPTEEPGTPTVETTTLVADWEEFGDVERNAMDAAASIPTLKIGQAFTLPEHDSSFDVRTDVQVFDADGKTVGTESHSSTVQPTGKGTTERENYVSLNGSDWDHGNYTVETVVHDVTYETRSATATGSFEITDPVFDVEVTDIDTPHTVAPGDPYQTTLTIRNDSGRDGTFLSPLSYRVGADFERAGLVHLNIPAGESREWESNEIEFEYPGEISFRLDEADTKWLLRVEE